MEFTQPIAAVHARLIDPHHPRNFLWDALFNGNGQTTIASNDPPIGGLQPIWPGIGHRGNFHVDLTFVPADSQIPVQTHAEFFADAKDTLMAETMSWFPRVPATPPVPDFVPFRPVELLPPDMQ